jgi:hypothetical protein
VPDLDVALVGGARFRRALQYAISAGVPRRSALVALIVGTILNLINQGDALFAGAPLNWAKIFLTYAVPYGVATYGAVSFRMSASRSERTLT